MSIPTSAHTLKKFDEELSTLRDLVLKMGGIVEEQVLRAMEAIERGDSDIARSVIERDRDIDRLELKADEEVAQLLARRAPLGIDLRTVLTLSKTVNDLERIGDEAKKIARIAIQLQGGSEASEGVLHLAEIGTLSRLALNMLHGALDALVRLDLDRATRVGEDDDALDDAYKNMVGALTTYMAQHPNSVSQAVQVMFAIKALERIGDHSKNIAEYVFYLVEGRDVRHPKSNPAMQGESSDKPA
ncbi:MAG TPA: phosphate transport system regulatory protein PhoU [Xanthomonadales bacterium]|nr:phosphate transport system regulatory protein PhoU [Xanthomonadales bacterium]